MKDERNKDESNKGEPRVNQIEVLEKTNTTFRYYKIYVK
jgi:hypothetical protein